MFGTRSHVCLSLVALLALCTASQAQHACTAAGIAGNYIVTCNGYLTPGPNAPLLPATLLSTAKADTNGQWSGGGTLSLGGSILTQDVKSVGPAQVNPDCTGHITYAQKINGNPAPDIHFNFVVEKGKGELVLHGISTDPGAVFSCTLTRVSGPEENENQARVASPSTSQAKQQARAPLPSHTLRKAGM